MASDNDIEFLKSVGGRVAAKGDEVQWNFGRILPQNMSKDQLILDAQNKASFVKFEIKGEQEADKESAFLWNFSKKANGGKHFPTFYQQTGSCVGNGLGQAIWYLAAVEAHRLGDAEIVKTPFWLLTYGRSRYYAGMHGRGEGSFGSAAAEAMRKDGILPFDLDGLPQPQHSGGLTWGSSAEMKWSDGGAIEEKWLSLSRKHIVKSAAQIRSAKEAREALLNYYPLTIASMFGTSPLKVPTTANPPVKLAKRNDSWAHQMCVIGTVKHPELGWIYYVLNSWGETVHGEPAGTYDEPPGGFWIKESDIDWICKDECFAFSQFNGFPAQSISWKM